MFFAIHYTRDLLSIPCHIFILECVCVWVVRARVCVHLICSWKCEIWLIFFSSFFFQSQTRIYAYIFMCIQMWEEHTKDAELIILRKKRRDDFRICFKRLDFRKKWQTHDHKDLKKKIVPKRDIEKQREKKRVSQMKKKSTSSHSEFYWHFVFQAGTISL